MTAVPLGVGAYKRPEGRLPEIRLVNMFLEKDPTNLIDGTTRLQRPGLAPFATVGSGPVRGVYRAPGVFGGDYIVVSGTRLYRVTLAGFVTHLGDIPGTDRVDIAAGELIDTAQRALIATGDACYSTDGATVVQVNMPDAIGVVWVAFLSSYFLLGVKDSHHIFWLAPGDVDPDALNFFSAQDRPGNVVGGATISDELWLFNEGSIEVGVASGDFNAPFTILEGRLIDTGCAQRDTLAPLDNSMFLVASSGIVCRTGTELTRVSEHGIEARIRKVALDDLRAWSFSADGHGFYCLTIGSEGTFCFDVATTAWCEFKTYGRPGWQAHLGAQAIGSNIVAGDDTTGQLYALDFDRNNDNGLPLEREATGGNEVVGKPTRCNSFEILAPTGYGPDPDESPLVQVCWSDDGGATWDDWREISLQPKGGYGQSAALFQLGLLRQPGRLWWVRMTDDAVFRISGARINETWL